VKPDSAKETVGEHSERVSEILHALSQPITALECGLELSLRKDKTPSELRTRLSASLATARLLHQRLVEFQALQDATEPGDTSRPVAIQAVLQQLREDYLPVAQSASVELAVKCAPAMVRGDEARLRNSFFHLLEFLMRTCQSRGCVRICGFRLLGAAVLAVNFSSDVSTWPHAEGRSLNGDLGLRIAGRGFRAAGGSLALTKSKGRKVTGYVHLLLVD
jgi:hypothetical protein